MSAEGGGGGLWSRIINSAKSFLGIDSNEKPAASPIEHTELDEITISANRKPSWFQRNFSKDKLSNDWKNIKERSGGNHFVNWFASNITLSGSGRVNNAVGLAATGVENSSLRVPMGTARPGAPVNFLGNNYYGNGRWYLKGAYIGKALGKFSLGLGTAMDTYGVYKYQMNPNDPSAVHPAKMGINLGVGIYGMQVNPFFGAVYGGAEALHPNGFFGAWADDVNMKSEFREQNGYPLIIQR